MPFMSKAEIKKMVDCPNSNSIIEKYNQRNGVILLSAHFGNWEYIAASVSVQIGIPFKVIVKSQRNPFVTDWLNRVRCKWKMKLFPSEFQLGKFIKN